MSPKKDNIPEFTEAVKVVFDALKGMDYKISADHLSNTDESVPDSNHHLTVTVKSKIRISIATDGGLLITFPSQVRDDLIKTVEDIKVLIDDKKVYNLESKPNCRMKISKKNLNDFSNCLSALITLLSVSI